MIIIEIVKVSWWVCIEWCICEFDIVIEFDFDGIG